MIFLGKTYRNGLKNLDKVAKHAMEKRVKQAADDIFDILARTVATGGCSPYDEFRFTYGKMNRYKRHLMDQWRMYRRKSGISPNSVSYAFENRAPHVDFLYGKEPSIGHSNAYRSDHRHRSTAQRAVRKYGKSKVYGYRKTQLTPQRWGQCKEKFQKMIELRIKT